MYCCRRLCVKYHLKKFYQRVIGTIQIIYRMQMDCLVFSERLGATWRQRLFFFFPFCTQLYNLVLGIGMKSGSKHGGLS